MEKTLLENKDMAWMWQNLCKWFYLTSISAYLWNKKRDIERKWMNINSISGINTFQWYETTKDSNNRMYNFLSKKDSEENSQCKEIANILKKNYTFKRKFNVYNDADIDYTKYKKQVTINGNNYSFFQTSFGTTGYNSNLLNIEVATKEWNKMTLCIDKKKEIFQSMTVDWRKVRIDIRREWDIMKSIDHLSSSHFISNKNNENAIWNYYIASDTKNKPSTDNISPQQLKNCIWKIYSDMLSLNLWESYEQN